MAGLFSMFDVTREGPGVNKNAPQKRSFVVFLGILRRKFWKLLLAGALFAVVNLPLITRGWADAGLTYVTRAFSRQKHAFVKEDFFETIRKNRKQAFICGFINFVVTALLLYNITYYLFGMHPELYEVFGGSAEGRSVLTPTAIDYLVMGCTFAGYVYFTVMKYYIPFLVITFDLSIKQIYRNAFIFSMAGLKNNLIVSLILIVAYVLLFLLLSINNAVIYLLGMLIWLLVLPPLRSLLIQYAIFPVVRRLMIDPYYEKHPDADKQLRRDLGLEVEATPQESAASAPVFSDEAPQPSAPSTLPRQYSEQELRRFNRKRTQANQEDDDTI
ncbi:MAG: DUF624 domain-containing protein [Ruminococcaceae bacterium]|nr:DUF624 domain-containing protein [Oscillospiraceae bacterium]